MNLLCLAASFRLRLPLCLTCFSSFFSLSLSPSLSSGLLSRLCSPLLRLSVDSMSFPDLVVDLEAVNLLIRNQYRPGLSFFFFHFPTDKKLTRLIVTFSSCVSVKGSTFLASFLFGPWVLFFSAAIDCVRPRAALRLQDAQLSCPRLMLSAAWPALHSLQANKASADLSIQSTRFTTAAGISHTEF